MDWKAFSAHLLAFLLMVLLCSLLVRGILAVWGI